MVSDQEEEDVKSEKPDDVFRLWVKLKIPKAEQQVEEEEEEEGKKKMMIKNNIGDDEKKKMSSCSINIERKRVCEICEKEFRSGKALGGHMRIHVHQPNLKKETHKYFLLNNKKKKLKTEKDKVSFDDNKNKEEKTNNDGSYNVKYYSCRMCSKEFPSMKSLSGHMRCHPERDWRGIHPPPKHKHTSSSCSSSYDHSVVENDDDDDDLDESNRAVDLTESLRRGWSVTAKRGRTKSDDHHDHDHELLEAVNYLMMLARGESLDKSKGREQRELVTNVSSKRKRKKMKLCDLNQNARSSDNNSHRGVLKFDLNHLPPSDGTDQATWN